MVGDNAGEAKPVIESAKPVIESAAKPPADQWTISAPTEWDTSGFRGLLAILREDRESTPATVKEGPGSKVEVWLAPGSIAAPVKGLTGHGSGMVLSSTSLVARAG